MGVLIEALAKHLGEQGMVPTQTGLARLARTGVTGIPPQPEAAAGEARVLTRLAPDALSGRRWAQLAQTAGDRLRHGRAVNLDPASLVLDTLLQMQRTARP